MQSGGRTVVEGYNYSRMSSTVRSVRRGWGVHYFRPRGIYTRCCEISNVVCDWARSIVLLLRDSGVAGRVHFPCHVNILLFATFTVHWRQWRVAGRVHCFRVHVYIMRLWEFLHTIGVDVGSEMCTTVHGRIMRYLGDQSYAA